MWILICIHDTIKCTGCETRHLFSAIWFFWFARFAFNYCFRVIAFWETFCAKYEIVQISSDDRYNFATCKQMTITNFYEAAIVRGNFMWEKGSHLNQSYDKSPYTNRNVKRAKWQHKQRHENVKYKRTDALSLWHKQQSTTVDIHGPLQTRKSSIT